MTDVDVSEPRDSSERERYRPTDASRPQGIPNPAAPRIPPFRSVGFSLSSLGYAVARRFRETLAPLDLEPREFSLLRAVGAYEGQSQQALGDRLQIPASKMVAFVDALEGRRLLERRTNPKDRRARALYLTEKGQALLARAFALAVGFERQLCAGLDDVQREALLDLLDAVSPQLGLSGATHPAHADDADGASSGPAGEAMGEHSLHDDP